MVVMQESKTEIHINNVQYSVKSVFAKGNAETLNSRIKRLLLNEKVVQSKYEKSHN